ncbi:MAG: hypothetical protein R3B72_18400 [Polyangiaceae bacterium]
MRSDRIIGLGVAALSLGWMGMAEAAPPRVAASLEDRVEAPAAPEEQADQAEDEEEGGFTADFRIDGGPSLAGSSWRGDFVAYSNLRIGVRFWEIVAPYAGLSLGYGTVDTRMLTMVTIGAQVWLPLPLNPYLRVGALHQHEESVSVIAGDVGKALFGVGDGIRHRPGFEGAAGVDIPFWEDGDMMVYGLLEGSAKVFPDDLGPLVYGGGGMNVGFHYRL